MKINRGNLHAGSMILASAGRNCSLPGVFTNNLEIFEEENKGNKTTPAGHILSFVSCLPSPLRLCVRFRPKGQKTVLKDRVHSFCLWQKSSPCF